MKMSQSNKLTQDQLNLINRNYYRMTNKELAELVNAPEDVVRRAAAKKIKTVVVRHSYNPETAYFINSKIKQ